MVLFFKLEGIFFYSIYELVIFLYLLSMYIFVGYKLGVGWDGEGEEGNLIKLDIVRLLLILNVLFFDKR